MKCACGAWSEVKETRQGPSGLVRRRVCANGHKFKTAETIVPTLPPGRPRKDAQHAAQA